MDGSANQERPLTPDELKHHRAQEFAKMHEEKVAANIDIIRLESLGVDPKSQLAKDAIKRLKYARKDIKNLKKDRSLYQMHIREAKENPVVKRVLREQAGKKIRTGNEERVISERRMINLGERRRLSSPAKPNLEPKLQTA
jgi:hypothetical protein